MTLPAEPGMTTPAPAARPSPAKAIGWAASFILGGFILMVVVSSVAARALGLSLGEATPLLLHLQTAAGLLVYAPLTWLYARRLHLDGHSLRWSPVRLGVAGFGLGLALGAVPALVAIALAVGIGGAEFAPDTHSEGTYLGAVFNLLVLLAPAALLEEVIFRGVGQVVLAPAIGRLQAILFCSAIFSLAHVMNPNTTSLGMLNIALAGIWLGVVFYLPGGIWTAWGAHLGWNLTLAALDTAVSGLALDVPRIDYHPAGPTWLTGGSFGPEGGLLATAVIGLGTVGAWRWTRKETV